MLQRLARSLNFVVMRHSNRLACIQELAAIVGGVRRDHPTRVAIDGVDGSGKTTLADELVESLLKDGREIIRASVDGFHNPRSVRYARGPDSPEGYFLDSFNYDALRRDLLEPLGPQGNRFFRTAAFDYRTDRQVELPARESTKDAVLLFDGVFLLREELHGMWDLTIWVDAPFEVTAQRAVDRDAQAGRLDPKAVRTRYAQRYVPGQRLYIEQCRPRERADIVFDNTNLDLPNLTERGASAA